MNKELVYIDSNVWLYSLIKKQDNEKHELALKAIRGHSPLISIQLINEICVNLIRKASYSELMVRDFISTILSGYQLILQDEETLLRASLLREKYSLGYYDSLHLSTALQSDAKIFLTEDMHDGQLIEGRLAIVNPFKGKSS